jgi:hypothetical protein
VAVLTTTISRETRQELLAGADEDSGMRVARAVAAAIATVGDTPHDRSIMAAAVLAARYPLTAGEAVEMAVNGHWSDASKDARAEGKRLLDEAAAVAR